MPVPDRKKGLYEAKLKGLVRSILGDESGLSESDFDGLELIDAPGGAGGIVASTGFILLGVDPKSNSQIRGLGRALVWADRHHLERLHVLVETESAAELVRRANYFPDQATVWEIQGASLVESVPSELVPPPIIGLEQWEFAPIMKAAGTRPVDDFGRLVAEVAGLEVARVSVDGDGPYLEVGVGQADRELQKLVHGGLERQEALERAASMVREHRYQNAPLHPLNRLARERWLRSEILDSPGLIGLTSAEPVPPLRPRSTLLGTEPCGAIGFDGAGKRYVIVCSVGVDVDLAAEAAEYRARNEPEGDLLIVVPQQDQYPAVVRTIQKLDRATLVSFPPPWGTPL